MKIVCEDMKSKLETAKKNGYKKMKSPHNTQQPPTSTLRARARVQYAGYTKHISYGAVSIFFPLNGYHRISIGQTPRQRRGVPHPHTRHNTAERLRAQRTARRIYHHRTIIVVTACRNHRSTASSCSETNTPAHALALSHSVNSYDSSCCLLDCTLAVL